MGALKRHQTSCFPSGICRFINLNNTMLVTKSESLMPDKGVSNACNNEILNYHFIFVTKEGG